MWVVIACLLFWGVAAWLVVAADREDDEQRARRRYAAACARYSFAPGYCGDPRQWCYWDREVVGGDVFGPFATRDEAVRHAISSIRSDR